MIRTLATLCLIAMGAHGMRAQSRSIGISPDVLRATLVQFAHDSLRGRIVGTSAVTAVANQVVKELTTLGLKPAGDKGKFLQDVPLVSVRVDRDKSELSALRYNYKLGIDYQPLLGINGLPFPRSARADEWLFGGRLGSGDMIDTSIVAGYAVFMLPPLRANAQPDYQIWNSLEQLEPYRRAGAILLVVQELFPASVRQAMERAYIDFKAREPQRKLPPVIAVTSATASLIMDVTPEAATIGVLQTQSQQRNSMARGGVMPRNPMTLRADVAESALKYGTQNVVAVLEGSDPKLRDEYVVMSARLDQADLDLDDGEERGYWPLAQDSARSGANAATGAAVLLEIARRYAALPDRPKRSIVFLWTVASENEGKGAKWFLEHSQIPRDRIVANIDIDRLGRGAPDELQVVGSRRLSSQLGQIVDEAGRSAGLTLDQSFDAPGHSAAYNCVGDHRHFALNGIPNVFVTAGVDADANSAGDRIEKIDFAKIARAGEFIATLAIEVANRPARPVVDKPRPDTKLGCIQ